MSKHVQTSDESTRSVERLHRILEASKVLNSTLDLAELTSIILRLVRDEVGTDRGTVWVLERDQRMLRSVVAQGVDGKGIAIPIGHGIAGTVAASGEIINIPDAYADPRFDSSFDAALGYRTTDIYCMPVINRRGEIVGVLQLLNRVRPLSEEDEEFLAGVSVHIGLALENAQMHREIVEKRKFEREMDVAREIQQNFYPNIPETFGGVQLSASSEMCDAVGGDYVGFFPLEHGRFIVTVGDVSGKGIGAALVMSSLNATTRAIVKHVHAIEQITSILNDTFVETTGAATFVTLLVMLVDPVGKRVHYIRAGHNPVLSISDSGHALLFESGGGPPVGLFSHLKYKREICSIAPGSVLVVYTDGVSEAENADGEQFGMDRLSALVARERAHSASEIHASIRAELKEFVGSAPTHDDSTLLILKF